MIWNSDERGGLCLDKTIKNKRRFAKILKELRLLPGYALMLVWTVFTFFLLGWVLAASFSTTKEIFSGDVFGLQSGLHFENYVNAWNTSNVSRFFSNSLVYTVISLVAIIVICAPASYALSRFDFIGNRLIQTLLVATMGVPIIMVILPLFGMIAGAGIMDNVLANKTVLVLLYIGMRVPYTTVFLLNFFKHLSSSYEEAAAIDGCSTVKTFWLIMFPMARGGVATVTIFNFINVWNEYFVSLLMANSDQTKSVAVGLFGMINSMKYTGDWAGMFAAVVIVCLPTLILYLFLSEKIIGSITGGLKG